jgi:hypothetical protein
MTAIREFVLWWDGLGEKRGNPTKRSSTATFPNRRDRQRGAAATASAGAGRGHAGRPSA